MPNATSQVNQFDATLPLSNVKLFMELIELVRGRTRGLPNLGLFTGPSGYGKSKALRYAADKLDFHHIEVGYSWDYTMLCDNLLKTVGIHDMRGRNARKIEEITRVLTLTEKPLLVDEADLLFRRKHAEVMREISDKADVPIVFVGLPVLAKTVLYDFGQMHNRVLVPRQAEPCALDDARQLARLYAPGVEVADDLLKHLVAATNGVTRYIATNLDHVRNLAKLGALKSMTLGDWDPKATKTASLQPPKTAARERVALAREAA